MTSVLRILLRSADFRFLKVFGRKIRRGAFFSSGFLPNGADAMTAAGAASASTRGGGADETTAAGAVCALCEHQKERSRCKDCSDSSQQRL